MRSLRLSRGCGRFVVPLLVLLAGVARSVGAQTDRASSTGVADPPPTDGALRLGDVLRRALTQHPIVEAARSRVVAARGTRRTAGTLPNPVLNYWVENAQFPGRRTTTPLDREAQTYAILPLEPLFQRWPRLRAADAGVRAADAEVVRARQLVALDAARAFYRTAAAQVAVDAADDVRARLAELVTYNQARVREGATAEADLLRTQVELDRVATTVTLARVELAQARAALAPYLGPVTPPAGGSPEATPSAWAEDPRDTSRVVVDDTVPTRAGAAGPGGAPLRSLGSLLATARTLRPDLVAARARVAAAEAEVGYQRTLTVRQVGATFGSKQTAGVTSMIIGLSLPLPLFDQNRGEVQRTTALRAAAEQELAWAERQATAEVQAAYASARLLAEQAARLRGTFLPRAEESRRIALAAYQEGAITLLQVLDASRALADARQMYYRTLFDQRQSLLELRAAIGDSVLVSPPGRAGDTDADLMSSPTSSVEPHVPNASPTGPTRSSRGVPTMTPTPTSSSTVARAARLAGDRP